MTARPVDLPALGWDDSWREAASSYAELGLPGRVVRVDRGVCCVLTAGGPVRASAGSAVLEAMACDTVAGPCTGDWVIVRHWPDGPDTVEVVLPRRTALVRAEVSGTSHGQALAANADLVALVVALHPEPNLGRLERMLSLAWESGGKPVVVLTKADLAADSALVAEDVALAAPGVDVICTSTVTGSGIDPLRTAMQPNLTVALLGASGHGKSSLANELVGADVLAVKQIRADGKGRHTSVRRELLPLPTGGVVIDTPGLRGVALLDDAGGLAAAFPDIERLAGQCRFSDCRHVAEPGCAVRTAVADAELPARRLTSWLALQREQVRPSATRRRIGPVERAHRSRRAGA